MSPVFADTAYFIALLNPVDQYHSRAVDLTRQPWGAMVTTTWVLVEVGDAFSQPSNRMKYARLVALLQSTPGIEVLPPSAEQFESGTGFYAARPDKSWSLTDCISFVIMRDRALSDALTTDHHFAQAGFRVLMSP